jgi:hypothetical protein
VLPTVEPDDWPAETVVLWEAEAVLPWEESAQTAMVRARTATTAKRIVSLWKSKVFLSWRILTRGSYISWIGRLMALQ